MAAHGVRVPVVLPGATRAGSWHSAAATIGALPPGMIMDAEDLATPALGGFDAAEDVAIPPRRECADRDACSAARAKPGPSLSRHHAAERHCRAAA